MPASDLLAKEEKYKLLNAKLEAKAANLVMQADQLKKEREDFLSKPSSALPLKDLEDEKAPSNAKDGETLVPKPRKVEPKKSQKSEAQEAYLNPAACGDALGAAGDSAMSFVAKTIQNVEDRMSRLVPHDKVFSDGDNEGTAGVSCAQIHALMANIKMMQEEIDQLLSERKKKDDENIKLSTKVKQLEEDRMKLQRTVNIQQTKMDKLKTSESEAAVKCDSLQLQVSALQKLGQGAAILSLLSTEDDIEVSQGSDNDQLSFRKQEMEKLYKFSKQGAAAHNTVELRLTRALDEVERLKSELSKTKQISKDKINEEQQARESLLSENKLLKKQKVELIVGIKKQLKLIDVLKRQKMHLEAAKLLSFTEDEFMKALDWGKT